MRYQKLFILAGLIALFGFIKPNQAFAGYGDWKVYSAYHHATKVVAENNIIYVLSDNGLYSYDPDDTSIETYDKTNGLSDNNIYTIVGCDATKKVVIVYEDGNIDLLDDNGNVYNMPELKDKVLSDKTINDVCVDGNYAYISTGSGIVVLDTKQKVFANYYNFGQSVNSIIIDNGYIIAATDNGVYKGKSTANLLDATNWVKTSTSKLSRIVKSGNNFYAINIYSTLGRITDKESFAFSSIDNTTIYNYCVCDNKILFFGNGKTHIFDSNDNLTTITNDGIQHAIYLNGTYWLAYNEKGLVGAKFSDNTFTTTVSSIIPNSPVYNYFYRMRWYNDKLLTVGGCLEYPDIIRTFTASKYQYGTWEEIDPEGTNTILGGSPYNRNATDIIQDPNNTEHYYISSSAGLLEYKNDKVVKYYSNENSPLMTMNPTSKHARVYVRTTALSFDSGNNLWMCNNECDTIIRILKTDNTWTSYYFEEIANHPNFDQIMFDERGWAWINSRRSGSDNNAGLFVLNTNGTLNQRSDDKHIFRYIFSNQDGTSYQVNSLDCIVEDLNGAIWIGTNVGPFVTYEPTTIFDDNFYFTQCKVPRNDGTNYADYLLNEIEVRCIAVDGGNRKWMGTLGNGVYLVNADGSEILEHFTTENSPLISDDIYSISIDGTSGEVFFATLNGLVSYMSNATDPEESFNKDLVKVYPNPVRPDYNGKIIITGLMSNSIVKIVNAAGRLVNQGTSVGGEYTWDGMTNDGKHVASGVYYVLATDSEGEKGVAGKFLVVKE